MTTIVKYTVNRAYRMAMRLLTGHIVWRCAGRQGISRGDTMVIVLADHEMMGIAATESMGIDALKKIKSIIRMHGRRAPKIGGFRKLYGMKRSKCLPNLCQQITK